MRFRFFLFYLSIFVANATCSQAQEDVLPSKTIVPGIKSPDPVTQNKKSSSKKKEAPTVITAEGVEAKDGQVMEATGNAEIRKDNQFIRADHLLFLQETNEVFADGSVRLEQPGVTLSGPGFKLNLDSSTGEMTQPSFVFTEAQVRGDAEIVRIESKQKYTFEKSSYTSCPVGNDDWLLRMSELELDRNSQIGTAYNARIEFMGVPVLYTPWMNFPLTDRRRSGLLGPVYSNSNRGGSEFTQPIYLNIASNFDATVSPHFIEKRGALYDNEFRYLGNSFTGKFEYGEIVNDKLALRDRSHASLVHSQDFGAGITGSLNLNSASDDAYSRDFYSDPAIATNKNLLREGALSYTGGGWWSVSARAQSYQTLQDPDPTAVVDIPYRRLPQVNLGAQRVIAGAITTFNSEYVEFDHPTKVNGTRVVLNPGVAVPLVNDPAYYLTPKMTVHYTQYAMGANNADTILKFERTVPIYSLDSGMTMERDFAVNGNGYVQTLEPRIFYVNIPYVDQSRLPNFDSAKAVFSFVQMFTENRFLGSDRIGDADQVTTALTSRILDADNGRELLRVAIGERFSRVTPRVLLDADTTTTNQSDVLLSVAGKVSNSLSLDSLVQYNPNNSRTEMFAATAQYRPEAGKVFNLGYRYTFDSNPKNTVKQLDLSTQWLVGGRWHIVAQTQYSLQAERSVLALAGVEYIKDCWAFRFGANQFVTASQETQTGYFWQLELRELLPIGTDTLTQLKRSIPGYTVLSERQRYNPPVQSQP